MNKFAEILNGVVGHIYIQEEKPVFAPYIKLIDITAITPLPSAGWYYDELTNTFSEENPNSDIVEPTLEEKIAQLEEVSMTNNLITIDAILSVYEEILALREEIYELKNNNPVEVVKEETSEEA